MSVKRKIKRLNKQIKELQEELQEELQIAKQETDKQYTKQLENIVKFALTNHIGNLRGAMQIERYGIDKMQDLRLSVIFKPEFNSYIIRVDY